MLAVPYKMFTLTLSSTQRMQFPSASPDRSCRWSMLSVSAVTPARWSISSFITKSWHDGTTLSTAGLAIDVVPAVLEENCSPIVLSECPRVVTPSALPTRTAVRELPALEVDAFPVVFLSRARSDG